MQLQLALDGSLDESLAILQIVHRYIDIAEIGTPLIFREGMHAVRSIRQAFPHLPLLADLKIMDAGKIEAAIAFEAGCQTVTVLGVTQEATIQGALQAANQFGGQVMMDMMQVKPLIEGARKCVGFGCKWLCIHTAYDRQEHESPLAELEQLRRALPAASLAVAGGIGLETIDTVMKQQPDIVIVGSAITQADDPVYVARTMHKRINTS